MRIREGRQEAQLLLW